MKCIGSSYALCYHPASRGWIVPCVCANLSHSRCKRKESGLTIPGDRLCFSQTRILCIHPDSHDSTDGFFATGFQAGCAQCSGTDRTEQSWGQNYVLSRSSLLLQPEGTIYTFPDATGRRIAWFAEYSTIQFCSHFRTVKSNHPPAAQGSSHSHSLCISSSPPNNQKSVSNNRSQFAATAWLNRQHSIGLIPAFLPQALQACTISFDSVDRQTSSRYPYWTWLFAFHRGYPTKSMTDWTDLHFSDTSTRKELEEDKRWTLIAYCSFPLSSPQIYASIQINPFILSPSCSYSCRRMPVSFRCLSTDSFVWGSDSVRRSERMREKCASRLFVASPVVQEDQNRTAGAAVADCSIGWHQTPVTRHQTPRRE